MTPTINSWSLSLALVLALAGLAVPALRRRDDPSPGLTLGAVSLGGQFALVSVAALVLVRALVQSDFSVAYVAQNSSLRLLPTLAAVVLVLALVPAARAAEDLEPVSRERAVKHAADLVHCFHKSFATLACDDLIRRFPDVASRARKAHCARVVAFVGDWLGAALGPRREP